MRIAIKRTIAMLVVMSMVFGIATLSFTGDKVKVTTNFFSDNAGMSVQSPTVELVKSLALKTIFTLRYTLDRVSLPPVRGVAGIPAPIDGITGASRPVGATGIAAAYSKNRNEFIAGLTHQGLGLHAYYSKESDYVGRMVTASIGTDFNQKNTNLTLSFSQGFDDIYPTNSGNHYTKQLQAANLTLTQALSPTSSIRVGADLQRITGYQNNPYRTVYVGGDHRYENHPDNRLRGAVFVKYNTYLAPSRASLWLDGRYYRDDWGVDSKSLGIKFYQYLSPKVLVRYRYRYYTQTGAYFFLPTYSLSQLAGMPAYYTADYKLQPFVSHWFGVMFEYDLRTLGRKTGIGLFENSTLETKYERYFSSKDFSANVFQVGLTFNY
jgi:hypothetical protein